MFDCFKVQCSDERLINSLLLLISEHVAEDTIQKVKEKSITGRGYRMFGLLKRGFNG